MARTQEILDWFRPSESKTLCPVWWNYVESDLPPNGALAALYGRRSRVSIRGWWTLIGVGYRFKKVAFRNYRVDPVILGSTGNTVVI
jgi:hypothetical protein